MDYSGKNGEVYIKKVLGIPNLELTKAKHYQGLRRDEVEPDFIQDETATRYWTLVALGAIFFLSRFEKIVNGTIPNVTLEVITGDVVGPFVESFDGVAVGAQDFTTEYTDGNLTWRAPWYVTSINKACQMITDGLCATTKTENLLPSVAKWKDDPDSVTEEEVLAMCSNYKIVTRRAGGKFVISRTNTDLSYTTIFGMMATACFSVKYQAETVYFSMFSTGYRVLWAMNEADPVNSVKDHRLAKGIICATRISGIDFSIDRVTKGVTNEGIKLFTDDYFTTTDVAPPPIAPPVDPDAEEEEEEREEERKKNPMRALSISSDELNLEAPPDGAPLLNFIGSEVPIKMADRFKSTTFSNDYSVLSSTPSAPEERFGSTLTVKSCLLPALVPLGLIEEKRQYPLPATVFVDPRTHRAKEELRVSNFFKEFNKSALLVADDVVVSTREKNAKDRIILLNALREGKTRAEADNDVVKYNNGTLDVREEIPETRLLKVPNDVDFKFVCSPVWKKRIATPGQYYIRFETIADAKLGVNGFLTHSGYNMKQCIALRVSVSHNSFPITFFVGSKRMHMIDSWSSPVTYMMGKPPLNLETEALRHKSDDSRALAMSTSAYAALQYFLRGWCTWGGAKKKPSRMSVANEMSVPIIDELMESIEYEHLSAAFMASLHVVPGKISGRDMLQNLFRRLFGITTEVEHIDVVAPVGFMTTKTYPNVSRKFMDSDANIYDIFVSIIDFLNLDDDSVATDEKFSHRYPTPYTHYLLWHFARDSSVKNMTDYVTKSVPTVSERPDGVLKVENIDIFCGTKRLTLSNFSDASLRIMAYRLSMSASRLPYIVNTTRIGSFHATKSKVTLTTTVITE